MRLRKEIENDGTRVDMKALEVLLDIRDLLSSKQEMFKCDICGKEVSTKLALAGHKRTHKE